MRLSFGQLAIYSLPIFGVEFIIYPTLAILPAFYATSGGGTLAAFGTAIFLSRGVYSWSGPVVGFLSDRFPTPWGRRKPWMAGGLVLAAIGVGLLFFPPRGAGPAYFGWASALALLAFSVIDIPYIAWGSEITRDYADRTRIASWRMWFATSSIVLFVLLPYVPGFGGGDLVNPAVIARLGVVALVVVTVTIAICLRWGPPVVATIAERPQPGETVRMLRALGRNRPMLLLSCATFFSYLPLSIVAPLQLAFLLSLGLGTSYGIVAVIGFAANLAAMPLWAWIAQRLGKQRSWALGMAVTLLSAPVFYLVQPLAGSLVAILVSGFVGGAAPVILFMPYSALGDVIDYDELRSGTNHAASFSALLLVVIRLTATVGGPAGFYALAAFGYSMTAANSAAAVLGLQIAYFGLPALCTAIAIPCALAYPLDARRAAIVRRRLEARRSSA
jgi:Na+/melibiose symporter-like transporter